MVRIYLKTGGMLSINNQVEIKVIDNQLYVDGTYIPLSRIVKAEKNGKIIYRGESNEEN